LTLKVSRIIPGDWGKVGSGWLARLLRERIERFEGRGRIHQFLWRCSRTVKMRMRDLAASGDKKPPQVESSSPETFRFRANRSHPEGGQLLLCISTVRTTLAGSINWNRPAKNAERRTKGAHASGRTRELGRFREKLPSAGDVKNDTAGL